MYVFRNSVFIRYTLKQDLPRLLEGFIGSITTIGSVSKSALDVICFASASYHSTRNLSATRLKNPRSALTPIFT